MDRTPASEAGDTGSIPVGDTMTLEEVAAKFSSEIEVPRVKPQKQFFFCPVGLVGAGKTTITKPISTDLNLVRLSSDELRKILKENGHNYESVKDIGFRIAKEFIDQGYSLAFDMDCGNLEVQDFVQSTAKEKNASIIWVKVTAPEDFIFNKFRNHPPSWLSDNPEKMINNHLAQKEKRAKENSHFDFLYIFDTSLPNLKEQIDNCKQLIIDKIGLK